MNANSSNPEDYETIAMETSIIQPLGALTGTALAQNIADAITVTCEGTNSESFAGVNVVYKEWIVLPGDPKAEDEEDRVDRRVYGVPNPEAANFLIRVFRIKQEPKSNIILPLN